MLYSIGDVHGRFDLLQQLHKKIMGHSVQFDEINTIVMLGDYVDRGPQSKEVIDFLITEPFAGFNHVYLRGNHEDMMAKSLYGITDTVIYETHIRPIRTARNIFLENGGTETLNSFGAATHLLLLENKASIDHIFAPYESFFSGLRDFYVANGYFFVHAGIMPGVPLDQQDRSAMLWIRAKFLDNIEMYEHMIIHGHTPTTTRGNGTQPEVRPNRINIDTGAYYTGVLTAICLDEAHIRRPEVINTHPDQ
jgi:serine/threonine protein phosphatase 1